MVSGTTRLLQRSAAEDMDGVPLRVPLRAGLPGPLTGTPGTTGTVMGSGIKKMRKRRELDALAKRCPPSNGVHKRCGGQGAGGGLSSHDQLLSESSGDDSSALPLPGYKPGYTLSSLGPLNSNGYTPGFAVKRRRPGRGGYPMLRQRPCAQVMRVCIGLLVLACVIATLTVMWLFIDVREQVFSLRTEIEQVVAGSQAVPDDLQKIHSLSRELQQNQTQLTLRVNTIAAQVANLSQQLVLVQTGLKVYSDQLQSNPEPSNVKELMKNVASLGSQIKDLHNTVKSVEQHQTSLDHLTETIDKNLTAVVSSISQLSNVTLRPATLDPNVVHTIENLRQVIAQTSANVSEANSTLTKRLQWLQDDQVKDHKAIEILQDLGQNVSARIKTLEGECAKIDAQKTINSTLYELKEQVNLDAQRVNSIEHTLSSLPQSATQKPPADSKSIMVEESKESLPVTLAEPVEGSRTTPGG